MAKRNEGKLLSTSGKMGNLSEAYNGKHKHMNDEIEQNKQEAECEKEERHQ